MKHFLLCTLLACACHVNGQNSLTGTVKNKATGEPIPGALIYVADLKSGVSTDTSGKYRIARLPKGNFLVECKIIGFNTSTRKVYINGETVLDFSVEETALEIQEVTVTGSSQSTEMKHNPVAMAIISQSALFENQAINLIDNISKTPGVNQLSTGAGISKPVIRGLGYNRIVTLNNNIRQEGQQWGDEHGIEIDEFSIDRVEIIKGPGSLMYGSDAIAGVINFLPPYPLPQGEIKSGAMANYQTNNHMQAYSLYNAGNIKGINWLLRGSTKQAGNYRNAYDGYVFNSGFKEYDANGYLGVSRSWGYSQLGFSSFNQLIAMPEGDRDSLGHFMHAVKINDTLAGEETVAPSQLQGYNYDIPRQTVNHNRITSNTRLYFNNNSSVGINLAYQQNTRKEYGAALEPDKPQLFFQLNTLNYDLRWQLPEKKGWHVSLGVNGMQQSNTNKGAEALIPDYSFFDAGVYSFVQKNLSEKLTIAGGLRFDNRSITAQSLYTDTLGKLTTIKTAFTGDKFTGFNRDYSAATGSLGFTYVFNERLSLKLNAARGFRAPNMSELSSNGKHEGTLRYERGDYTLKPETSLQGDLGLTLNTSHLTSELSVFYNDIQNYIYLQRLQSRLGGDSISNVSDPTPTYKYTQGSAYLYGGEFSIDIHPHPLDWLHIENSFSMVNGIQKNQPDSMMYLPFIPAPRYQGELRCEFKKTGKILSGLYVSASFNYYFPQDHIHSAFHTETKTPDYGLLNAALGGNIVNRKGNTLCTVSISANNITDVAYQNHLSRLKYAPVNPVTGRMGIYNTGRNFSFKISVPIVMKKA